MFALFPSLESMIKPEQINAGCNLMILSSSLNDEFGALELALEPTDDDRTYKIVTYPNFSGSEAHYFPPANRDGTRLVTFHHHEGPLELPSHTLLSTHSAVARILHASGMAEIIDRVLEDAAEVKCLASDGSTDLQIMLPALLAC
ncbi:uncharacterized protein ASPGLDRAFT_45242 [Aspergillus glaucus CBS 516.65]|uniref:HNH nuclease domain-containing protein n=1 Tax=Aspergillus glaucus CBS 516.65 TaxID=1160497 RepID=A0A1L9VQL1_ASPGL|nr:hypothetical protein ASPGLDRAFT_45242 [Aspergillus glaucus CBS 516.65]OJJ86197.1 hypothetical protein ASPGLDRAFT_45242 [Aspergillus glaucus CBS 516.65]